MASHQTKNLPHNKGNNRAKRQPTEWEKIFTNCPLLLLLLALLYIAWLTSFPICWDSSYICFFSYSLLYISYSTRIDWWEEHCRYDWERGRSRKLKLLGKYWASNILKLESETNFTNGVKDFNPQNLEKCKSNRAFILAIACVLEVSSFPLYFL
jgi:hypothetical protein